MDLPLRPPRSFLQSYHGNSAKVFRKCFSIDLFRGSATVVLRAPPPCRVRKQITPTSPEKLCRRRPRVRASPSEEEEPIPRAMSRTREERRGYPLALVRSLAAALFFVCAARAYDVLPSLGRSVVGSRYSLGQTPPSIFLCGRQTFRTGRKMRSSMKALPPFPLRALSSSPPPLFVI